MNDRFPYNLRFESAKTRMLRNRRRESLWKEYFAEMAGDRTPPTVMADESQSDSVDERDSSNDEKPFKYLIPSLQHMACVRLALTMWSEQVITPTNYEANKNAKINPEMIGSVDNLSIPEAWKKKLIFYTTCFEEQLNEWYNNHSIESGIKIRELEIDFCWSSRGSIDYVATAERIKRNEQLPHIVLKINYGHKLLLSRTSNVGALTNYDLAYNCDGSDDIFKPINTFLPPIENIINSLVKLDERKLKSLNALRCIGICITFLDNFFYLDYFLQTVIIVQDLIANHNYEAILIQLFTNIQNSKNEYAYFSYVDVLDKFREIVPISMADQTIKILYLYITCFRWEEHFDRVKNVLLTLTADKRKQLLTYSSHLIAVYLLGKEQLEYLKEFVQLCLPTDEDISEYKVELMAERGEQMVSDHFITRRINQLELFLNWVGEDDEEKIRKFKSIVLLHVFASILKETYQKHTNIGRETFATANLFLKWCLPLKEERKYFKSKVAENYIVRNLNGSFNKTLVYWLLENDNEQIKEFTKKQGPIVVYDLIIFRNKIKINNCSTTFSN